MRRGGSVAGFRVKVLLPPFTKWDRKDWPSIPHKLSLSPPVRSAPHALPTSAPSILPSIPHKLSLSPPVRSAPHALPTSAPSILPPVFARKPGKQLRNFS